MRYTIHAVLVLMAVTSCSEPVSLEPMSGNVANEEACDVNVARDSSACEEPTSGGAPPTPGLLLFATWSTCTNTTLRELGVFRSIDSDEDGVTDFCEQEVASAFGPLMNQRTEEFFGESMLLGEYYHGVNKIAGVSQTLRLVFIPAYFMDQGTRILGVAVEPPKPGDGEFFVIDVRFSDVSGRWYTVGAFMSQHGEWPSYNPTQLEYQNNVFQGTPLVYVANWTQAHYPTDRNCDQGGDWEGTDLGNTDECDGNRILVKYPVDPAFNFGSYDKPLGRQKARRPHPSQRFDPEATESMWTWDFCGWQGCLSLGGFADVLKTYGFFPPPPPPPGTPVGPCPTYDYCPPAEFRSGPSQRSQPVAPLSVRRR
jgi:hypothetical protein